MFLLGAHGLLANGIPVGAVDGSRSLFALLTPDFSLGQVSNRRVAAGGGGCRHLVLQFIRLRHRPSIRVIVIVLVILILIVIVVLIVLLILVLIPSPPSCPLLNFRLRI